MGSLRPLLLGSCSRAVGNRCAAQIRPPTHVMMPYLMLAPCAARGMLKCAKEVAAAPILSSAAPSLRLPDRLSLAERPNAEETCGCDNLAMPEVNLHG